MCIAECRRTIDAFAPSRIRFQCALEFGFRSGDVPVPIEEGKRLCAMRRGKIRIERDRTVGRILSPRKRFSKVGTGKLGQQVVTFGQPRIGLGIRWIPQDRLCICIDRLCLDFRGCADSRNSVHAHRAPRRRATASTALLGRRPVARRRLKLLPYDCQPSRTA